MSKLLTLMILVLLGCSSGSSVYLCNGPQSKAYHKISDCRGLKRCSTAVEAVDIATAKARKRSPCGYCF